LDQSNAVQEQEKLQSLSSAETLVAGFADLAQLSAAGSLLVMSDATFEVHLERIGAAQGGVLEANDSCRTWNLP